MSHPEPGERELYPDRSARHRFGYELRVRRKTRGLSKDRLGAAVHVSGDLVGRIEIGDRRPVRDFAERCDRVLDAGGELVRLWEAVEHERHEQRRRVHTGPVVTDDTIVGNDLSFLPAASGAVFLQLVSLTGESARMAIDRRTFMTGATGASSVPIVGWFAASPLPAPPTPMTASTGSVFHPTTAGDVPSVRAMVGAFQTADRTVGGGALYTSVLRYLTAEVAPKLVDPSGGRGGEFFAAAATVTELAGWMAHDGGRNDTARMHFDRAFRFAAAADRPALAANVCASMSHLANQLDQPTEALRIADAGLRRAHGQPGTSRLIARLHTMCAHSLALSGESRDCAAELSVAEDILSATGEEQPAEWLANFDEAALASEAALCWLALGQLAQAERAAQRVITLRTAERVRSRAFAQLTLARVLLDDHRPDEAAVVGQAVCSVVSTLTSARVLAGLDQLGDALRPYQQVSGVGAFLDHMAAVRPITSANPAAGGEQWPV